MGQLHPTCLFSPAKDAEIEPLMLSHPFCTLGSMWAEMSQHQNGKSF